MAVDYQVVFPTEAVKLTSIQLLFGSDPLMLIIYGQDFSAVDEVLINEIKCPSYQVLSKTKMLAEIPAEVAPASIRSINVTSRRLVLTDRSVITFRISQTPAKTTGLFRLMQLYLKLMLSTPGTDIFDQSVGGGLLGFVGSTFRGAEGGDIVRNFIVANDNVARQIIAIQSRQPELRAEEKLLSAHVISARFSAAQSALLTSVELISQAGKTAKANLVL